MWCQMYIAEQFPSCLATPDAMLDVHTTISLHLLHSFFAVSWRARGRRWLPPCPPPLPLISSMFRFIPQKSNVSPLTPLFFLASPQFTSWSWPSSSFFCFSSSSPPLFPPLRLLTLLFPFIHPSFCLFYPLIPPVILPFSLSLPFHIHHPSSALLFIPLLSALFILSSTHLLFIALTSRSSFSFPPNLSRLDLGSAGLLICLPLISSSFFLSVFYSFCFKTLGFTSSSLTHIFFIQLLSQNVNHCKLNPELIEYVQEWNFSFANNRTRTSCQTSRWQTQNHLLYPLMETMRSWRSAVCFTAATSSN